VFRLLAWLLDEASSVLYSPLLTEKPRLRAAPELVWGPAATLLDFNGLCVRRAVFDSGDSDDPGVDER
jgi:hypothetical protein